MKSRLVYQLLAAAALTGAVAGYVEISGTVAQPTDGANAVAPDDGRAAAPPTTPAATPPSPRPAANEPPSGNPLWSISLKQLSFTKERPIFSPSRRPPPPPPAAPAYVAPVVQRPPPKPREPERPTVSLVGTVASSSEAIGVFLEPATRNVVRLRVGEDHEGWVLRSVKSREATLEKDSETAVLALPPPGGGDNPMFTNSAPPPLNDPAQRRQPRR
jgi:hypothetical protein